MTLEGQELDDGQVDGEAPEAPDLTQRWPAAVPLPGAYVRPVVPCPRCRAVRDRRGRRAALQTSGAGAGGPVVTFQCRACGHGPWKLRVVDGLADPRATQ